MSAVKRKATHSNTPPIKFRIISAMFQFTDLSDSSLLHVFECMDVLITLARMSNVDDRCYGLIMRYIIPYRTINFNEFELAFSVREIFELFGKSMTRIAMGIIDHLKFAEFLRMMVEYIEPSKLKAINDFSEKVKFLSTFMQLKDSGDIFTVLAKHPTIEVLELTFDECFTDVDRPVKMNDLNRLTQLKTLHLRNYNDKRSKEFMNTLLVNLPALTTCTIGGHLHQKRIIELIESAPKLKELKLLNYLFSALSVQSYMKLVKLCAPPSGQDANENNRLLSRVILLLSHCF